MRNRRMVGIVLALCLAVVARIASAADNYSPAFSTFLGGTHYDSIRDVCVDAQGDIIVVGGTSSANFPTKNAWDATYATGGTAVGQHGPMDVFVAKFDAAGALKWSTYLGGPNYDRAYGVEADPQGNIYVTGRAGPGFPVTAGAFQTTFVDTNGSNLGVYGKQNGFVAKFTPAGQLVWASYVGSGQLCRDIAVDSNGDIYLPSGWNGVGQAPPAAWFANGYQKTRKDTVSYPTAAYGDTCILKVKSDGTQVLWGTWLCGTGQDHMESMIRLDAQNNVYWAGYTTSRDMPIKGNGQAAYGGGAQDWYLAKLTSDGSDLIYGTYLGGNGNDQLDTHQLAVDSQGNAYCAILSTSTNWATSAGAFQTASRGGNDIVVCKIGLDGTRLLCTYIGGSGTDVPEGLSVDGAENVYITGNTRSPNFPVAGSAYQPTYGPDSGTTTNSFDANGTLTVLAADFKSLVYSSFMGSRASIIGQNAHGGFHASVLAPDGGFIMGGSWFSANYPLVNAYQTAFLSGPNSYSSCDATLVRFVPVARKTSFNAPASSVPEGTASLAIPVSLDAPSTQTVRVNYAVTGGSATAGQDYTLASGTLTFNPGVTSASIAVAIVNDSVDEADETIQVTLSAPVNAALGATTVHTVTILDDDMPENVPPVANAGADVVKLDADENGSEPVTLDGTGSADADGVIVSYVWMIGGTQVASGPAPTLVLAKGSYVITLTVTDDAGATATDTVTVTVEGDASLMAHWKFDEGSGTIAGDSGGYNNTGTLLNTGTGVWVDGKRGKALMLDGVNDAVVVPTSPSLALGRSFTIAAWIKPVSYAYWGRIVSKGSVAGSQYNLILGSNGIVTFKSSDEIDSPSGIVKLNVWQHVALTYDGTTLRLYVDAIEKAAWVKNLTINSTTESLYIGNVAAGNRPLKSGIDEVRIYGRTLSLSEIQSLAR